MQYSFDIFSIILIAVLALVGYKNGILKTVLGLVSTAASAVIAYLFCDSTVKLIGLNGYSWSKPAVSIGLFVICAIILAVISRFISRSVNKIPVIGKTNRILGCLLGILFAGIILLIISSLLWCILTYAKVSDDSFLNTVGDSYVYNFFCKNILVYSFGSAGKLSLV